MAQIFISLGSNIERDKHIRGGLNALQQQFGPLRISSVYESEPVGFTGCNFYNLVVEGQTQLPPLEVVAQLKAIELRQGRKRTDRKFAPRTLDLDLLLYDQLITEQGVELPRGEICYNAFVLWPLAELAPELRHPVLDTSYRELWQNYDKTQQSLWAVPFAWPVAHA